MARTYTTAHSVYDGFGSVTVNANVGSDHRGKTVRLVETPEEHLEWQRSRYGSGMEMAATQEQWEEWIKHNLVTPAAPKTAMMRQFEEAKRRHSGMMLLFRMGDFYEAFGEDAETLAKALTLTVTSRDTTPMAGFPHHQLDNYLRKLLAAGHRIALCDQVDEAPLGAAAGKIVIETTPAEAAGAPAEPDLDALGRRWAAGESIALLGKEACMAWQKLHGLLRAKGYRKAGRKEDSV